MELYYSFEFKKEFFHKHNTTFDIFNYEDQQFIFYHIDLYFNKFDSINNLMEFVFDNLLSRIKFNNYLYNTHILKNIVIHKNFIIK